MKACSKCMLPLVQRQDNGEGAHIECPPQPDRERYLRWKHKTVPGAQAWHDALAQDRKPWKENRDDE